LLLFKAAFHKYAEDSLCSASATGRFHQSHEEGQDTVYLGETWRTCWREVSFRWKAQPSEYRKAIVSCQFFKVADLTREDERQKHGISVEQLLSDDYQACQELAKKLRSAGYEAIRTYSRADPDGHAWIVFKECLQKNSILKVQSIEPVNPDGS
jgi:RES domain-containing protein